MARRNRRTLRLGSTEILWIAFILIFLLGTYGWLRSSMPASEIFEYHGFTREQGLNAIYRSLQEFTLNFDHPIPDNGWQPSVALNIARFLAALFLVAALVVKLSRKARNAFIKLVYADLFRGQQFLVIGYGQVGQGLARALKEKHPKSRVVAIDRSVQPLDREAAAEADIWLYEADGQDLAGLAKVPIRISRLDKILVSIGNDQQTIATASRLVERHANKICTVWMQLNDWTLLDRLRNSSSLSVPAEGARKIRSFSMAEALGTQIIAQYHPVLMARRFGQNRLHAVLIRFDDFVWAIAEALVLNGTAPPPLLARPRLSIIDTQAEVQQQRWLARHPALQKWADITFIQADPTTLAFAAEAPLLADVETLDPPTLYLFGRSGDGDALADALSLRHGMEKGFRQPAPVFLTSEVEGIEKLDLRTIPANLQDRLEIVGADAEMAKYSHVIDPWFEALSGHFFAAYKAANPDTDAAGNVVNESSATLARKYRAQEETLQVSNRRAAIHATQILAWLGFEHADATRDWLGLSPASGHALRQLLAQRPEQPAPGCDNWKDMWAIYEHMRWCVDRAVDGWRHGERDDEARRRDQMNRGRYDYHALGSIEVAKDTAQANATSHLLCQTRAAEAADLTRIETLELPVQPSWHYEAGVLALRLPESVPWPPLGHDGASQRLVLRIPAEAKLAAADPAFAALPPKARKSLRLSAYRNFIDALPARPWRRFRLLRSRAEGWEWLDKDVDINAVEGCTLPPLTVGFVGVADGLPAADMAAIEMKLAALFDALAEAGRPMRLIMAAGKGTVEPIIDIWRTHKITKAFPIVILHASDDFFSPGRSVAERILHAHESFGKSAGATKATPELQEEMGERILNVCDHLITLCGAPGTAAGITAGHARDLGIAVHPVGGQAPPAL